MAARDFKKELKHLYQPPARTFAVVEVPPMDFLMADGHGDPNASQAYNDAVSNLFGIAYALKFMHKKQGEAYTVMPLEGLWWVEDMARFTVMAKDEWDWTMMIMQPVAVTPEMLDEAREQVRRKRQLPSLPEVRLESYAEGLAVQTLYVGSYADEGPTIAALHDFIHANGYELTSKHHEIYLGDPKRTAPEKLKTIIRQPVRET